MKPMMSFPKFAYVGCFTTKERSARGKGISVYSVDRQTAAWTLVQVCESLPNPGFLAIDRGQKTLYVAHGKDTVGIYSTHGRGTEEISAYTIEQRTGKLTLLNRQPSGGDNSRRVTIDPTNRYVLLANGPGVALFPVNADGSLAPWSDLVVPPAEPGTFREEEKGPHPHDIVFDPGGRFVVAPDKGLDRIHIYRLDVATGKLNTISSAVASLYGAAPRHIAFHPVQPFAYVVNERDSTVAAYHWNAENGELNCLQVLSSTPDSFNDRNKASEIALAPSGHFVYASNRGHDSIVVCSVDDANGRLTPVCWESTQGEKPRFFTFDASGTRLYAANENSDTIVVFAVDQCTGKLSATGQIVHTESPACIAFTY